MATTMTTEQAKTRIAEIDAERRALYQKGGTYLGSNGQPRGYYPELGRYVKTNADGWTYIKGRYAELMREREALAKIAR